jgi:hypothetical protein
MGKADRLLKGHEIPSALNKNIWDGMQRYNFSGHI